MKHTLIALIALVVLAMAPSPAVASVECPTGPDPSFNPAILFVPHGTNLTSGEARRVESQYEPGTSTVHPCGVDAWTIPTKHGGYCQDTPSGSSTDYPTTINQCLGAGSWFKIMFMGGTCGENDDWDYWYICVCKKNDCQ